MKKKIVAIGGGGNGRLRSDGSRDPYELANQDKEIIRLTGKPQPNFLFIAHAQPLEKQQGYFQTMVDIYGKRYGCNCKDLKSNELKNTIYVKSIVDWADIVFVGGGNTLDMITLWKNTGFDKTLEKAWICGKVMCGISAGANCWFKECSSGSLKAKYGNDFPLIKVDCLGFVNALFVPHGDNKERQAHLKGLLNGSNQTGLAISNCAALEIVDDEYRLITSSTSFHNIKIFGIKSYWKDGQYIEKNIDDFLNFKPLIDLIETE